MTKPRPVPKYYSTILRRLMKASLCPPYQRWDSLDFQYYVFIERLWKQEPGADLVELTHAYWAWKTRVHRGEPAEEAQAVFDQQLGTLCVKRGLPPDERGRRRRSGLRLGLAGLDLSPPEVEQLYAREYLDPHPTSEEYAPSAPRRRGLGLGLLPSDMDREERE
jgi:hypothetical protein